MYVLNQFEEESTVYNIPAFMKLKGNVDKNKLEKTIKKLNLATRKDIEDINKRLDEISKKLK